MKDSRKAALDMTRPFNAVRIRVSLVPIPFGEEGMIKIMTKTS